MKKLQVLLVVVVLMGNVMAHAKESSGWNWNVVPYAWMSGMKGDIAVKGVAAPVDQSFSDILKNLEIAGMLALDGNNGTWGTFADLFYVNLSDSADTSAGKVKADMDEWIISIAPYYRVVSNDKMTIDVGAGGRYIDMRIDISAPPGSRSGSQSWLDPIVTARLRLPLADKFSLNMSGDIGGFGVESDLTWQLATSVNYLINDTVDFLFGYRHLDLDYQNGDFLYDAATSGFALGVRISF
jgi:hypothetical protein